MAVHHSVYPARLAEDNLASSVRIMNGYVAEGIPEKGDGFGNRASREIREYYDYGKDRVDRGGSSELMSADILDILPSDPFGMDIDLSTTFTAITGWLEDLELDCGGYGMNKIGNRKDDYELFAGFDLTWDSDFKLQSFPDCTMDCDLMGVLSQDAVLQVEEMFLFTGEGVCSLTTKFEESCVDFDCSPYGSQGTPHEAFILSLAYLGPRDLLSVECVCKSLRHTVSSDPLLWRRLHIDKPLNDKITDDVLLHLTNRAEGNLHCLSLVECPRITDDGLKRVFDNNTKLTKLCVPGCTRLTINGIMNILKSCEGNLVVKHLRIGGFYGITREHFEDLKCLLGVDRGVHHIENRPHYYHRGNSYLLCDDDRALDIEICPRCQKLRLVYDCPVEGCKVKDQSLDGACRACSLCIQRCFQCGRCINDRRYEETFCLDILCVDCFNWSVKCHENEEELHSNDNATLLENSNFCRG